jgi:hypothetical protein
VYHTFVAQTWRRGKMKNNICVPMLNLKLASQYEFIKFFKQAKNPKELEKIARLRRGTVKDNLDSEKK